MRKKLENAIENFEASWLNGHINTATYNDAKTLINELKYLQEASRIWKELADLACNKDDDHD